MSKKGATGDVFFHFCNKNIKVDNIFLPKEEVNFFV